MPFQKGRQKTGGRKKGTRNKKEPLSKQDKEINERVEKFTAMTEFFYAQDFCEADIKDRLAFRKALLPYILKKPK